MNLHANHGAILRTFGAAWRNVAAILLLGAGLAQAQTGVQTRMEHLKSGFALSGAHVQARCEDCHQNGIFAGTPRDCATCHVAGMRLARGNVVKPVQHVPVTPGIGCESCHNTQSFVGARFNHAGVIPGSCATCHARGIGQGKPGNHIPTTASCDACHRIAAWLPATGFDHGGVAAGTCATCHGAGVATGKPASHIPTTASCDSCHRSFRAFRPAAMNHTVVIAQQCKGCHNGSYTTQGTQGAFAKPANHIPEAQLLNGAALDCNACHAGTTAFNSVVMNHNNSQGNGAGFCRSCHATGTNYLGRMDRMALTHRSATATDCSQSGCHRPLGTRGTPYTQW
jgi:hypothetical protein